MWKELTGPQTLACGEGVASITQANVKSMQGKLDIQDNYILVVNLFAFQSNIPGEGYSDLIWMGMCCLKPGNPYPFLRVIFVKKVPISKDFSHNIGLFFKIFECLPCENVKKFRWQTPKFLNIFEKWTHV